jgi:hypothetical protein
LTCINLIVSSIREPNSLLGEPTKAAFTSCRVFATRLVLKGPMPCVLVDVRIKLAFRIFVQQRNGSFFCSTAGLDLVRPEVPYLEYGIMVSIFTPDLASSHQT